MTSGACNPNRTKITYCKVDWRKRPFSLRYTTVGMLFYNGLKQYEIKHIKDYKLPYDNLHKSSVARSALYTAAELKYSLYHSKNAYAV